MINWLNLAANSLWILACALGLAGVSHAVWNANVHGVRLRQQLASPVYQQVINLAGALFCTGLAATATATWETVIWALLTLAFLAQLALVWRPAQ
jgi:hypothetical protein